ncbi:hypothetical protein KGO5_05381 [Sinorhizobium sp. KGO-5]|nr:hypothetical protein KGO5_05381 [Sinorhizobium sp. KGO-5]
MFECHVLCVRDLPKLRGLLLERVCRREVDDSHGQRLHVDQRFADQGVEVFPVGPEADDEQILLPEVGSHPNFASRNTARDGRIIELRRRPHSGLPITVGAAMEFQQGCLTDGIGGGFVSVERAAEVRAVVPCASLDQRVVVARYASNGGAGDEKIRDRGMSCIRRPHKSGPGHEMFDEDRLQGVEACKVLGECLQIVPKAEVAVRVRFETVFVEAPLGDRTGRWQAAGRRHRESGAADHQKAAGVHGS